MNGKLLLTFLFITTLQFSLIQKTSAQTCTDTTFLYAPSGVVEDGSGDAIYDDNLDCFWLIDPPGDDYVRIEFTEGFTQIFLDKLTVYDGTNASAPEIAQLDWRFGGTMLYATSGSVFLRFESDNFGALSGWELSYSTAANVGCLGDVVVTSATGVIQDGSGQFDYSSNSNCSWLIQSTNNKAVALQFTEFDVHESDTVYLYDGANSSTGTLIGTFTGNSLPLGFHSAQSGQMYVHFVADGSEVSSGWKADFQPALNSCNGGFDDGSGDENYGIFIDEYYLISPDCTGDIVLEFISGETENAFDYVYVYDGASTSSPQLAALVGDFGGTVLAATSGSMLLRFITDASVSRPGWEVSYCVYDPNSYELSAGSGSIADGSNGCDYRGNVTRTWTLTSTTNQVIGLNFTDFDVHPTDLVRVYDGNTSGTLLGSFTGSVVPADLLFATSGTMLVLFESDGVDEAGGWTADYSEVPWVTSCSGVLTDGSAESNYEDSGRRFYVLAPSCGLGSIAFVEFSTQDQDSLYLYDGMTLSSPSLGSFAGSVLPPEIHSTSGTILFEFVSDATGTSTGWEVRFDASEELFISSASPNYLYVQDQPRVVALEGTMVAPTTVSMVSYSTTSVVLGSTSGTLDWIDAENVRVRLPANLLATTGTLEILLSDALLRTTSTTITLVEPMFCRYDFSFSSGSRTINILANDDVGSGSLISIGTPDWGSIVSTGNSVVYTPNPGFTGFDSFEYTIGFEGELTSTGSVTTYTSSTGANSYVLAQLQHIEQSSAINRLKRPRGAVVSSDGEHVYVAAYTSRAVSHFTRAGDGSLTYVDNVQGSNKGLSSITQVALSPDGRHLYSTSRSEFAVGVFGVHATTGSLTYVGRAVRNVDGVDGLKYVEDIVVSPDGRHVYTVSSGDRKLTVFARSHTTGTLTFIERFKDGQGGVTRMRTPRAVAISPDGKHVYVAAYGDHAVNVFSRKEESGRLTFVEHKRDNSGGVDGLLGASGVAVSPDGSQVFVTGYRDESLAVFDRNATTGALTFVECLKDGELGVDGLNGAMQVRASPSGQHIFTAARNDNAVAHMHRNTSTEAVSFAEFVQRNTEGVTGLYKIYNVTVDPESNNLYAMGNYDNSVTVFQLEAPVTKRGEDNAKHIQQPTESLAITNVFPLPATDYITIEFAEAYSNLSCTVLDLAGREVSKTYQPDPHITLSINTTTLASGSYFLLLESGPYKMFVEVAVAR